MSFREINFDGLVGPTHNYSGLSYGNVASGSHKGLVSHPRAAVLQGLEKMKALSELGLVQGILPPQERPNISYLRNFGFIGSDIQVIDKAYREEPILLSIAMSASSMWTANAATVSPSADTLDGKVHFSVANLNSLAHRAQESKTTYAILKSVFNDDDKFNVHKAIAGGEAFGDEGAANHTRLCSDYGAQGVEVFVYGRHALDASKPKPKGYPARQTIEASHALARRHQLKDNVALFVQQNPEVINKGVFHNDVISVGNKNVLLFHEDAFLEGEVHIRELFSLVDGFVPVKVNRNHVSVEDAVRSYLFNTQLVSVNEKEMAIIAPKECEELENVHAEIKEIIRSKDNPINHVHFFDLRESMQNGGGPACLRLRVTMSGTELASVNQGAILNSDNYTELVDWAHKHYREELSPDDLRDPKLLEESRAALDELTKILELGSIYEFQK